MECENKVPSKHDYQVYCDSDCEKHMAQPFAPDASDENVKKHTKKMSQAKENRSGLDWGGVEDSASNRISSADENGDSMFTQKLVRAPALNSLATALLN